MGSSYYDFLSSVEADYVDQDLVMSEIAKERGVRKVVISKIDERLKEKYKQNLLFSYKEKDSVSLPLKTSVTATLSTKKEDDFYEIPLIFTEDVKEKGTLMHRFLEYADLNVKEVNKQMFYLLYSSQLSLP